MSQQPRSPPQLETYRNMLDSMVQFLQISSSLIKQKAQISLDCEPECVLCTPEKKCVKCSAAEKEKFIKQKKCQVEEQCKAAALAKDGSKPDPEAPMDVPVGTEAPNDVPGADPKPEEAADNVPKENGDKEPCVCEQVRTIKSEAGIGGDATQQCSSEVKRKCNCSAKSRTSQKCVCPTDDEKTSLYEALMTKLDSVQKQIDLVRVDIGNLSGKSKSAALYKEIMKGSTSTSTSRTTNTQQQPSERSQVICPNRTSSRSPTAQYPESQYLQMSGEQMHVGPVRALPLSAAQSTPKPRQMIQTKPPSVNPIRSDYTRRPVQRGADDSCLCLPDGHPSTPTQSSEWINPRYQQGPGISQIIPKTPESMERSQYRNPIAPVSKVQQLSYGIEILSAPVNPGYNAQYTCLPYATQDSRSPLPGYGNVQGSRFRPLITSASPSTPSMSEYRNVPGYRGEYECQDETCDNEYCGN